MRRECLERFPRHRGLAIPTCTCRDVFQDRKLAVSFEMGPGENATGIPGACATRSFTYLVRGPSHTVEAARCGIMMHPAKKPIPIYRFVICYLYNAFCVNQFAIYIFSGAPPLPQHTLLFIVYRAISELKLSGKFNWVWSKTSNALDMIIAMRIRLFLTSPKPNLWQCDNIFLYHVNHTYFSIAKNQETILHINPTEVSDEYLRDAGPCCLGKLKLNNISMSICQLEPQAPLSPSNCSALYRRSRLASHELNTPQGQQRTAGVRGGR